MQRLLDLVLHGNKLLLNARHEELGQLLGQVLDAEPVRIDRAEDGVLGEESFLGRPRVRRAHVLFKLLLRTILHHDVTGEGARRSGEGW